jgi:hypothetical protein
MPVFTVGVFEHPKKRVTSLMAYTRWYSTAWDGCCTHTVEARNGTIAKEAAKAEHRSRCMAGRA